MRVANTLCHTSQKYKEIKTGVGSGVHCLWLEHILETGKALVMSKEEIRAYTSKCTLLR